MCERRPGAPLSVPSSDALRSTEAAGRSVIGRGEVEARAESHFQPLQECVKHPRRQELSSRGDIDRALSPVI